MGRRRPSESPAAGAASLLRVVLEAVERGALTAPATMIAYLEGALAALGPAVEAHTTPGRSA